MDRLIKRKLMGGVGGDKTPPGDFKARARKFGCKDTTIISKS